MIWNVTGGDFTDGERFVVHIVPLLNAVSGQSGGKGDVHVAFGEGIFALQASDFITAISPVPESGEVSPIGFVPPLVFVLAF